MTRFLPFFLVGILVSGAAFAGVPEPGALCHPNEEALFSCRLELSGKMISLCASQGLSRGQGYLQYRAGDFQRLEDEFPTRSSEYRMLFSYLHYTPFGLDHTGLSFVRNGAMHELFSHREGPPGAQQVSEGQRIGLPNAPPIFEHCRPPVIDNLSRLEGIF